MFQGSERQPDRGDRRWHVLAHEQPRRTVSTPGDRVTHIYLYYLISF